MAAMERGLTMSDIKSMQLGQIVDFTRDYNERQKKAEETAERRKTMKNYRLATPEEISEFTRS